MPYAWTNPDVFLSHRGVDIYYLYQDDFVDNPTREFWYGLYPTCSDGLGDGTFDIRDVELLLAPELRYRCRQDHQAILTALIDAGILTETGFLLDGQCYDQASRIRRAALAHLGRLRAGNDKETL